MKYIFYALVCSLIIINSGCKTENPFLEKSYVDSLMAAKAPKPVERIVFIMDDNVFYLQNFEAIPKKIYSSGSRISSIKINPVENKIAFLSEDGSPVIIDTEGTVLHQLGQYKAVSQMDWTHDGKTLYMLINEKIELFGKTISLPTIEKEYNETVISAAVSKSNSVYYVVKIPLGMNRYTQKLKILDFNGEETVVEKPSGEVRVLKKVNISKDGNHFVLSYTRSSNDPYLKKVSVYKMDKIYPDFEREFQSLVVDPIYDDHSKYLTYASSGEYSNSYSISANYTSYEHNQEKSLNKYLEGFTAGIDFISVDWK